MLAAGLVPDRLAMANEVDQGVASLRPMSVSLQTSQSGFSGLLNHGSAQPRSRQRRHDGRRDGLAVEVEQRQLAARLGEAAAQVEQFRKRRKIGFQFIVIQRKDVK